MSNQNCEVEAIDLDQLVRVNGGMPASAHWIMMHESGGDTHARNPTSTAYGAFQMLKATRQQTMGADWQSSDLNKQYAGATKYVNSRYGGSDQAQSLLQRHQWH